MFRGLPGQTKVQKSEYTLFSETNNFVIDADTWASAITPGALVTMSMVIEVSMIDAEDNKTCPRCKAVNENVSDRRNRKVICRFCQLIYEFVYRELQLVPD